jgi:hypothetical protein
MSSVARVSIARLPARVVLPRTVVVASSSRMFSIGSELKKKVRGEKSEAGVPHIYVQRNRLSICSAINEVLAYAQEVQRNRQLKSLVACLPTLH